MIPRFESLGRLLILHNILDSTASPFIVFIIKQLETLDMIGYIFWLKWLVVTTKKGLVCLQFSLAVCYQILLRRDPYEKGVEVSDASVVPTRLRRDLVCLLLRLRFLLPSHSYSR